jgi:hypothetical protein
LKFALQGDSRVYFYARKSGSFDMVSATLEDPTKQPIALGFDPEPREGSSGPPFYQVLELRSKGGSLRTYDDIRVSWRRDYQYGLAAGTLLLLGAIVLEWHARCSAT